MFQNNRVSSCESFPFPFSKHVDLFKSGFSFVFFFFSSFLCHLDLFRFWWTYVPIGDFYLDATSIFFREFPFLLFSLHCSHHHVMRNSRTSNENGKNLPFMCHRNTFPIQLFTNFNVTFSWWNSVFPTHLLIEHFKPVRSDFFFFCLAPPKQLEEKVNHFSANARQMQWKNYRRNSRRLKPKFGCYGTIELCCFVGHQNLSAIANFSKAIYLHFFVHWK